MWLALASFWLTTIDNVAMRVLSFRLDRLRTWHKPTYDAVIWLRSNSGRFRGVIHEPMMLVVDVKNVEDAKYVETHISNNDKKVNSPSFLCEMYIIFF